MWLEEIDELFKGFLPYYVLLFLPVFIIMSPATPVSASHEFPVYRMQHYDLHGVAYGCRSSAINLEARSLTSWSTSRHCVLTKLLDLTVDHFRNIYTKAGALIVMLPEDLTNLNPEQKQHILLLENAMMQQETTIPVYFSPWSRQLDNIMGDVEQSLDANDVKKSAVEAIFSSIAANGYQITVGYGSPAVQSDNKVATIHGHLSGYSNDGKTPTIAIVAHYDSFGVAPELSFGADSNGSGVSVLLELVRLFSELYSDPKTRGKYNIVFVLTGGGKINYQGSKKWLEDQLDSIDTSYIQDASYVMCLDTLATSNSLYMHVSKPPKEGSPASTLFKHLKTKGETFGSVGVEGVHKKINLADDLLAWEHERYSIRRLSAFTLSTVKSHKDGHRATILDTKETVDVDRLANVTKVIAEAVASQVYNVSSAEIFSGSSDVNKDFLETWEYYLATQPRSPQLLAAKDNVLVNTFKDTFNKYLRDVKVTYSVPDKRDPDFQFYGTTKATMNVYSVKPAVFDLVLTLAIVLYLSLVYLFIIYFPRLYSLSCSIMANRKVKSF